MHTAYIDKKTPNPKNIQVEFVTSIQAMVECFLSLYELKKSSLQDVFLYPSSQCDDIGEYIGKKWVSICDTNIK